MPLARDFRILGTYAQTELSHGSNVSRLETEAVFDEETDEFVLNTPSLTARKWWVGGLAKSCTHCILMARLKIKGKDWGVHPFILQVSSHICTSGTILQIASTELLQRASCSFPQMPQTGAVKGHQRQSKSTKIVSLRRAIWEVEKSKCLRPHKVPAKAQWLLRLCAFFFNSRVWAMTTLVGVWCCSPRCGTLMTISRCPV